MWEIVGYEINKDKDGKEYACTLYVEKELVSATGEGKKAGREWYKFENCTYRPRIGDRVVICKEDYGKFSVITEIIVMN